ncbi:N-glycosylase/DNA lyase [Anaerobacterium chartisolvens]|uniref:DNA-(apurinic or apyrimidinic site) lyase n=1 Tax=Anaerobacterium chartisolvens TaxID=1297424 RepID=A0A369BBZ2_9FIRM|nr:DNA glycosylase [Anaerobacterium chartisolvens]RCX18931.1 N-glycosylase/DNA lyase [Anaerobacterium chartisolvens]
MDYRGYEIYQEDGKVIAENVGDFNCTHIFECGQCFRWIRETDGSYTGVVRGRAANISFCDGRLIISNTCMEDFKNIWFDYLDLGRDYGAIKAALAKDDIMKTAIEFGHGIRLLKQDIWETLISFIISANNRIPRIMRTVERISQAYGEEIEYRGKSYYKFPATETLSSCRAEQLEAYGAGFRCKYIVKSSVMVKNKEVDIYSLGKMDADSARSELTRLAGVGNKVADCTLLYSGTRYDVFPTDVWVKRVMEELYFKREASFKEIQAFAHDYFGQLAGFAQQYLFYYAREHKIGVTM